MRRHLAHSLYDEIPPPRPPIEPTRATRADVLGIIIGVPVMAALILGIPFLLWLIGGR